ncbi:MAG TPA: precorrin-6y C5,15-methyltransferase (decarboxylating) subunit CbiE [Stellaceae bacterium]|nr:precorrin-6y C5,15-methyltransferase (decarboxylating) subunit CbiE [Stellaceae bacterium]
MPDETPWLTIVGIGEDGVDGLSTLARAAIDTAELLVGGARHLAMLPTDGRQRLSWASPLTATIPVLLEQRGRRVCVLASGDPMWFGIGATLARHVPAAELRVIPAPSAFSLAAARLAWPLAETVCLSIHGRPTELVVPHLHPGARLLLLAWDGGTPETLARLLCRHGFGSSEMTVLEAMGGGAERRRTRTAAGWLADPPAEPVAALNTIGVLCRSDPGARLLSSVPGLPDAAFEHDGQLTKQMIRAVTLAALAPRPGQMLWDVGAGAGSVAIEWLRADPRNRAIAIERRVDRADRLKRNAATLGTPDLITVTGAAPEALDGLDPPDAIFIGGGLGIPRVIERCWMALPDGGRLVANAVTLEGEAVLLDWRARHGGELNRLSIARAEPIGGLTGWRPAMPVTQWSIAKP